ncbi:hypothetical protein DSM03_101100 [Leeuwenhoekiella aestuarii]|uniref:HTH domain-containing protein n=1 Tax=Leeuwenhoekiella aestuarii TaxID=2249426 RepID=A0A4V1KP64_9FLAO|nr:hypothetical protein [Leeuwenhoekiella aestuarii]RXG13987.1 hypothetical protein DSM04_10491 [Leeuwenhoekiella aestuarii]RXG18736.1 hypothetical protein DSM03_101100 [Leeuwenhoekiella aestuarii]
MNRDKNFVKKRIKRIGLFFEIKKAQGLTSKVAIIEIAQALSVSRSVVVKDLGKYNKSLKNEE